jgi:uncharacterized RDD family membrane protein YckC
MPNNMQSLGIGTQPTLAPSAAEPDVPLANVPQYVGFGRRAAAKLIDSAVHLILMFIASLGFGIVILIVSWIAGADAQAQFTKIELITPLEERFFSLLGFIAYTTLCEGIHGSSLGKMLLGIVVTGEDLKPCTLAAAFKRSLAFIWDGMFFGFVGYHAIAGSPENQRNGDYWAETVVVKRKSAPNTRGFGRFLLAFIAASVGDMAVISTALLVNLF